MIGRLLLAHVLCVVLALAVSVDEAIAQADRLINEEQFAKAQTLLSEASRQHPSNVELRYRLGYVLFRQRKSVPAAAEFQTVIKSAPDSWRSRYFLGRIALLDNQPAKAVQWLEPVVNSGEPVYDAASQLAKAYAATARPKLAMRALKTAIQQAPWDGSLYYRLGRAYESAGEKALAKEAFETSQRLTRSSRDLVEKLMKCADAVRTGDRVAALAIRDELMATTPFDPDALVALGSTLAGGGLHAEAAPVFELAVEKAPELFQAQYNLGLNRLKRSDVESAAGPLTEAVRLLPRSVEASAGLGTVQVLRGRYADAIPPLERAHAGDAGLRQVPGLLAVAYLRTGNNAKAAATLRSALKDAPDQSRLWFLLIETLNKMEDPQGALEVARQAQQRFAENPQANLALGQQLARAGQYAEAGTFFERVLASDAANPHARLGLAESLEKKGEAARALELYQQLIPTAGVLAELGAARSLVLLRQLPEAREALERAAQREPQNQQVRIELARVYARLGLRDQAAEQNRILQDLRRPQP